MVERGMTPLQAIHAATVVSAELIDRRTSSAASSPGSSPTSWRCRAIRAPTSR